MKKALALILAALLVLSLAACAAKAPAETPSAETPTAEQSAEEAKPFNLGLANINEKATFGKLVKMGFEEACAARGWTLTYVDNNSDGQTAVTNAQILVNNEVDFVVDLNVVQKQNQKTHDE